MPLPMEVKQKPRRGHGFLGGFSCFKHFPVDIDWHLHSTYCGVELFVSCFSIWRSLSCILYRPIWVKFGSGKEFQYWEIMFSKFCRKPVQLAHNEVRYETGPGKLTLEIVQQLCFYLLVNAALERFAKS